MNRARGKNVKKDIKLRQVGQTPRPLNWPKLFPINWVKGSPANEKLANSPPVKLAEACEFAESLRVLALYFLCADSSPRLFPALSAGRPLLHT